MATAYLTRRVAFSAAHRYYRDDWSPERNAEVFGACANPHGHGHNYVLEVTVEGRIDAGTGFAVDLTELDAILEAEVVRPLDHRHINHAVPEFGPGGLVPTTENLVSWAWPRIARRLPTGARLHRLRLHEDERLFVDYFGGGAGTPP